MADVVVISDTIQEFNGERFYLCGYYFQHNGKRLHRAVWEHHNGRVPKGFHVHHKDHDRSNNSIENLELLDESTHLKEHINDEIRKENGRKQIVLAIEAAKEWHHSEEGKKWHSEHAKQAFKNRKPITYRCTWCGKEFESLRISHTGNHFCCNNHKAAYRRKKVRDENSKN